MLHTQVPQLPLPPQSPTSPSVVCIRIARPNMLYAAIIQLERGQILFYVTHIIHNFGSNVFVPSDFSKRYDEQNNFISNETKRLSHCQYFITALYVLWPNDIS